MTRYLSLILVLLMLSPIFSQLVKASAGSCSVGPVHECTHGDACPMHGNKHGAGHGHHADGDGGNGLICHVSNVEDENSSSDSDHSPCCVISCEDEGASGVSSTISETDYLTSMGGVRLVDCGSANICSQSTVYTDPPQGLTDRPPASN